jgi:hypothetical protein
MLAIAAATLANGGVNPFTQVEVFDAAVVRSVLCQMASSGMYDGSGAFTLRVGLPAKSGVAGAVLVVVPNVAGFASFSPRLDEQVNPENIFISLLLDNCLAPQFRFVVIVATSRSLQQFLQLSLSLDAVASESPTPTHSPATHTTNAT